MFNRMIRLTQAMRQQGEDDILARFRLALSELRVSRLSRGGWELLCTRFINRLSPEEVAAFDNTLRLYLGLKESSLLTLINWQVRTGS